MPLCTALSAHNMYNFVQASVCWSAVVQNSHDDDCITIRIAKIQCTCTCLPELMILKSTLEFTECVLLCFSSLRNGIVTA